ncbi:hypothetical protein N177_3215 [Lutibaculum baratangense AMV1]|uniref:Uncharacterized protein n=1 Tax=Lutibaculum baratangense AMV1 TaxID=631454 RepID=V4QTQ1_9HYPH|nr:hypothetical protein N177_3215 [Lutibaculum baratangense AMV1]
MHHDLDLQPTREGSAAEAFGTGGQFGHARRVVPERARRKQQASPGVRQTW